MRPGFQTLAGDPRPLAKSGRIHYLGAEHKGPTVLDETRGRITRDGIRIYEDADFAGMAAAGRVAAEILDLIGPLVVPGVTTEALDSVITEEVARRGVIAATIG